MYEKPFSKLKHGAYVAIIDILDNDYYVGDLGETSDLDDTVIELDTNVDDMMKELLD